MQTFQPLLPEETLILKKIYRSKNIITNASLVIGILCIIPALLLSLHYEDDNFLLGFIIVLSTVGLLALFTSIRRRAKNKRLFKTAFELNQKELITGYLKQVEIVKGNKLEYHFKGFSQEVNLTIRGALIQPFHTLTNIETTLHIVSLADGEHFLMKAVYDQPVFSGEIVTPFTAEDKKILDPWARSEAWIMAVFALVIGVIISLPVIFTPRLLIFTLGIPILICICVFIPGLVLFKISKYKILLTTRVTESITVYVKSGKYSTTQTWYRLDNGLLENFGRSDFQVGNTVCLYFLQKRNGKRGFLVNVEKK